MTRDWLLTLLVVVSPYLFVLAALIVALVLTALTRRPAQHERVRRTAETRAHDGADQMEEAKGIRS